MELVNRVKDFWFKFIQGDEFTIAVCVTALVFLVLYYYMIKFLVSNNAQDLVAIFVAVMIIAAAVVSIITTVDNTVYLLIPALFVLIIMTLFSVELKRLIWAKRNAKFFDVRKTEGVKYDEEKIQHCINEIIKALQNMSKNDVGAILVLSTGNIPSQIIDSGVKLDSDISADLIESVFFPKTPLHDGAMIINGAKIVAAGCFLPLSQNIDSFPKDLGTRHRAGIGVTETIDVISLIVSEETGIISIARGGKITRYADTESLKNILGKYYWQEL